MATAVGLTSAAPAQISVERQRLAAAALTCRDRCDEGFAQCLGGPRPGGPLTPIPRRGNGDVPTPPPYEECLLNRDICVAQCEVSLAEGRKQAAERARRVPRR